MALLGEGSSSSYPVTLDTPQFTFGGASNYLNGASPIPDSQSRVDAEFMNDVIDAIVAIENELGLEPSGSFATVRARLDAIGAGFPGPTTTDNAIVRWDGVDGDTLQNSVVIVSDTGEISGVTTLDFSVDINGITTTEFARLTGITANIQAQLDDLTTGAASSTDNALVRFHLTTGKIIQNSAVILNDSEDLSGMRDVSLTRNLLFGGAVAGTSLTNGLVLSSGTAPSGSHPADAIQLYVTDVNAEAANAGLIIRSEAGDIITLGHRVGLGATDLSFSIRLHVAGDSASRSGIRNSRFTNDNVGVVFDLVKSRGTEASPAVVQLNDIISRINYNAYARNAADSANTYILGGDILGVVSQLDAQNRIGMDLAFRTSAGVSATVVERLRIRSTGEIGIAQALAAARLHITNGTTTTGQLILGSARQNISPAGLVIGGVEFWSDDTNLTAPGQVVAYMRALNTETHTATALGTELLFSTTPNATTSAVVSVKLNNDGRLIYRIPSSAPTDADIPNSHMTAWVNEGTNTLTFRVRKSDGSYLTGTVVLA